MCGLPEAMMASKIILGGLGSYNRAQATARHHESQAAYLSQKAVVEQERLRRQARQQAARKRVGFAASGVQIAGSPTDVLAEIATESAYRARLAGWDVAHRTREHKADAEKARREGGNLLGQSGYKVAADYGEPLWKALTGP
jgi:hypothetical protein